MARKPLGLYCDSVSAEWVDKDWSEARWAEFTDDGTDDFWEAVSCDECGRLHVSRCGGSIECDGPEDEDDPRHDTVDLSENVSGPMMNGFWPLSPPSSFDPEEAARAVAALPLCVVEVDGVYGLALTGGGMDLSWEIAAGYIACGCYPPAALRLPEFAGGLSKSKRRVARAMLESYRIAASWAMGAGRSLRELLKRDAAEKRAKVKP